MRDLKGALFACTARVCPWVFISAAAFTALLGVLIDNFLLTVHDTVDTAGYLNVFFACAMPFLPVRSNRAPGADFAALATVPAVCCALFAAVSLLVKPDLYAALPALGLLCVSAPVLALLCALRARIESAGGYFTAAFACSLGLCFAPAYLPLFPLSPALARALIAVMPGAALTDFFSGILNVRALFYAAALCALFVRITKKARRAAACALLIALAGCTFLLPAAIFEIDVTQGRVLTPSSELVAHLRGLSEDARVTLVARPGAEDPWIRSVMTGLAQRHAHLSFAVRAPEEDEALAALSPEDNCLLVESAGDRVLLRPDSLYATRQTLTGTKRTFEMEGALLTALGEVTGLNLLYGGAPPGRALNTDAFDPTPARAGALLALLLIWTALPVGAGLPLRRKL